MKPTTFVDMDNISEKIHDKSVGFKPRVCNIHIIETGGRRMEPTPDIGEVLDALHALANAEALANVPKIVAGWNGPPEKPYAPHPAQLGARIETTCGRIYKLDAALAKARDVLSRAQRSMDRA